MKDNKTPLTRKSELDLDGMSNGIYEMKLETFLQAKKSLAELHTHLGKLYETKANDPLDADFVHEVVHILDFSANLYDYHQGLRYVFTSEAEKLNKATSSMKSIEFVNKLKKATEAEYLTIPTPKEPVIAPF